MYLSKQKNSEQYIKNINWSRKLKIFSTILISVITLMVSFSISYASLSLSSVYDFNSGGGSDASSENYVISDSISQTFAIGDSAGGQMKVSAGFWPAVRYDTTPPGTPINASAYTHTIDTTPTWDWISGGGGAGVYRYRLDNSNLYSGAAEITGTSFTPVNELSIGNHVLYVQERDEFGNWSQTGQFTIVVIELLVMSCSDEGIECIERVDKNDDSNNLVFNKPKSDVEYKFIINVSYEPENVQLYLSTYNEPTENDYYKYSMTCNSTECTYNSQLGSTATHKFYFVGRMVDGTSIRYPEEGYITGPEVLLLNGYNIVGLPRDVSESETVIDGVTAFSSTKVYRWNSVDEVYEKVVLEQPVTAGEGYYMFAETPNIPVIEDQPEIGESEYSYILSVGWNLISNPYSGNVNLSDIKFKRGAEDPISWIDAVSAGYIVNSIFSYSGLDWGSTYYYRTVDENAVLFPWNGYWVHLNEQDEECSLIVPKP